MTKEQMEIILLGSRFETMNKYVDLSNDDGTIRDGIAKAMQEYAERYYISKVIENEQLQRRLLHKKASTSKIKM